MASVGQELRRERELRGISLKEIGDSTKISIRLLRALEEDRLDILPGKFFTKGIICAYAKYLGLEEESVLNKYYEDLLLQEKALETEGEKKAPRFVISKDIKKFLKYGVLFIILVLILLAVYYFFPGKEEGTVLEKTPIPKAQQEEKSILPPPVVEESIPEVKEISLEISFLEKTWIQVYADGELKLDGIKNPGESAQVTASEEFILNLGNAGGVVYNLNSKKGRRLGPSGSVVKDIKITLDNLQEFLVPEEKEINS